ncbi:unnamed protein product [Dibothriocephalus latus]|uniref:Uncharacterized protein n=1 Tax=Dibothriocephalus latus TaxID=60516 RepID=A0A3P7L122_DIBLA|nr:unnamed protein product [Dibothriocephalus latus]
MLQIPMTALEHGEREKPITHFLSSAAECQPSPAYAVSCDLPSEDEVADEMQNLCNKKTCDDDGIHAEIYKSCVHTLAH